ncbi:caspase family protein [Streptomyces sp. TLI_146]|uniref:caspase family protein n=1 Tax=Streptomyces sp. TLI_146 TaxID=1938858 RepID=UPI000C70D70A|nr:caspase family protein [Streptomyces sp. TLI_146]PKV87553.1 caspase domain-containing protein [Streptomyces sp. TLI_146]
MRMIYALLVGIDAYRGDRHARLSGCVNDVLAARRALEHRVGDRLSVRTLLDGEATAAAVESALRDHLGQAGPDDTALLWFSGHGTELVLGTAEELAVEATGRSQALVCVDGPLPDKRLGALLDGLAAGGAHVAAVLDCCFSGGGTREHGGGTAARFTPPDPSWLPPAAPRDTGGPQRAPGHVLLAASRLNQLSYEADYEPEDPGTGGPPVRRGVFTHALLDALRTAGPDATYRELLAAAHARVRRTRFAQHPVLFPADAGGLADTPFLGGAPRTPSPHLLRFGADGWEVDCGRVHGLPGGLSTEFTATGPDGGVLMARAVLADRTLVDPDGWAPQAQRVHPVALSATPLASAAVTVDGPEGFTKSLADHLTSPLVRLVTGPEAESAGLLLRVEAHGDGQVRVLRRDGSPFVAPLPLYDPADTARVADCLTHLAHWHGIRDLEARTSPLRGHIRVEVVPWGAEEPLAPDGNGEIVRAYDGPREPWVSIRLRNAGDRPLWCVLLDLNDRYAVNSSLFPGHFIAPGHTGYALDGRPVQLSLPATRAPRPGAYARDWLKLIVAEGELNTVPFRLGAWDPYGPGARGGAAPDGVLRLAGPGRRDVGAAPAAGPGQWATRTVALRTVVPGVTGPGG